MEIFKSQQREKIKTKADVNIKQISISGSNLLLINPCLNKKAIVFMSKFLYARLDNKHSNGVISINCDYPFKYFPYFILKVRQNPD